MKWYYHLTIVVVLILFTFVLYQDGFGFIPFLIAAVYLAITSVVEFKRLRNEKG